jgi:hypothetical protein
MMVGPMLRAGAWPAVTGVSGVAVVAGGCGVAFSAAAIRSLALLAPLAAGAVLMLAGALRGLALPWAATGLALAGNVVLGFAAACVVRTRTGEPGAAAGAAVVLVLMAPTLLPPLASRVSTFPTSGGGLSSNTVWWTVLAVCVAAVAVSVNGRPLPRWLGGLLLTTYTVMFGAGGTGITMGRDRTS